MKIKTPNRANFSRSARLCDQNLYHVSSPNFQQPTGYQSPSRKHYRKQHHNYFFKSISRQKRGSYRFSIPDANGQYIYFPDFNYVKRKSSTWVIPKEQKYSNQKYQQYQFCHKHPLIKQNPQANMKATQSMKSFHKPKLNNNKSSFMMSTSVDSQKNYSILNPRQTSPSGFFNKTKIQTSRYLAKRDLSQLQAQADHKKYNEMLSNSQRGFIDLNRQKQRKYNVVRKSFEYLQHSDHEKQFNNYSMVQFPTKPENHIDFQKHMKRPQLFNSDRLGPNPQALYIDFSRRKVNNVNYKLGTFRDKIKTRFDRVQPQPNTRLQIDLPQPKPKGMVSMQKAKSRYKQLFPIVDSIIKKSGDRQMKQQLKKHVFRFQINQAHKPVNPDTQIRDNL